VSAAARHQGPRPVGESMPRLLARLGASPAPALMDVVFTRWEEVVGAELGGHLRPLRVDGRALVVAADHPAWATRARMASADILSRVRSLADTPVERLEVVVERV
jgi:predicted nucleic acid-binding Zn ribbon protein